MEICLRVQSREPGGEPASRQTPADDRSRALQQTLLTMSDEFQIERCRKCHTVDQPPGAAARIQWKPSPTAIQKPRFVKFSHRPHLTLKMHCESCHEVRRSLQDKPAMAVAESDSAPPEVAHHSLGVLGTGLQTMQREQCATCHTRQSVGDSCLKCHNYHIGRVRNSALSRP